MNFRHFQTWKNLLCTIATFNQEKYIFIYFYDGMRKLCGVSSWYALQLYQILWNIYNEATVMSNNWQHTWKNHTESHKSLVKKWEKCSSQYQWAIRVFFLLHLILVQPSGINSFASHLWIPRFSTKQFKIYE